jgi:hypothetical protein
MSEKDYILPVANPKMQIGADNKKNMPFSRRLFLQGSAAVIGAELLNYYPLRQIEKILFTPEASISPVREYTRDVMRLNNLIIVGNSIAEGTQDFADVPAPAGRFVAEAVNEMGGGWGYELLAKDGATSPDTIVQIETARRKRLFANSPHNELILCVGANDAVNRLFGDPKNFALFQSLGAGDLGKLEECMRVLDYVSGITAQEVGKVWEEVLTLPIERALFLGTPDFSQADFSKAHFKAIPERNQESVRQFLAENEAVFRPVFSVLIRYLNARLSLVTKDVAQRSPFPCGYLSTSKVLQGRDIGAIHPDIIGQQRIADSILQASIFQQKSLYDWRSSPQELKKLLA